MVKPNLSKGIRLAMLLLFANIFLVIVTYALHCLFYGSNQCGIIGIWNWFRSHPAFPLTTPATIAFGFVVGAFGGLFSAIIPGWVKALLSRHQSVIAWVFIILLIAAFAIWGIPDLYFAWNS